MIDKNTGGPAFPCNEIIQRDERGHMSGPEISNPGMTLRDYFAAQTLVGAFNSPGFTDGFTFEEKAAWVYQMADAMLEVRNAK